MRKQLLLVMCVFTISFLMVGCSSNHDATEENMNEATHFEEVYEDPVTDTVYGVIDEPPSCSLLTALHSHEAVINVNLVTLPPRTTFNIEQFVANNDIEHMPIIYSVRYTSDAYQVMGFVAAPGDFMYRSYPILIYNRGGNRDFGALTPDYVLWYAMRGYIVLASQYRGILGGTGQEQFGGDDINDVLRLIDISENLHFAQQGGVYMLGVSRGGKMTYIASRMDDRIRAAAVWAAISNSFESFYEREDAMQMVYVELVGGTPEELPEEFERRSAVMWADEIIVPLLIGHGGEADWRVPTHHAINMAEALENYGKQHRLIVFPDADHSHWETNFLDEMDEWFRQFPIQ